MKVSLLKLFVGVLVSQYFECCHGAIGAFCRNEKGANDVFPTPVPHNLLLPWIWDAVYIDFAHHHRYVEITAVAVTRLNSAAITTLTEREKQQAVADVENANILLGERLQCEFLDDNDKLLYVSWSDVITGNPVWLG